MGEITGIAWTDHTFNPWIGCAPVSPACAHCYAEEFAKNRMKLDVWDRKEEKTRHATALSTWAQVPRWNTAAREANTYKRVFCASMADVFEDHPIANEIRPRLWTLISKTDSLIWLLLTKRPENVMNMLPEYMKEEIPSTIWIGTSVENQRMAEKRIPILASIPAHVRFLSCEPLLSFVNIRPWSSSIQWVIAGGESGAKHRPMNISWATSLHTQCTQSRIPFFFKQVGGRLPTSGGHLLNGKKIQQVPAILAQTLVTSTR
jgi:protein gp37